MKTVNKTKIKSILFTVALLAGSANAFAAGDICTNQEGAIVYDSATTFGTSVVVTNPRLQAAGKQVLIKGSLGDLKEYYGSAICKAMGMQSGVVGALQEAALDDDLFAEFDSEGVLEGVVQGKYQGYWGIKVVTCKK